MTKDQLIIGTRKSPLALWQSEFVKSQLEREFPGLRVELKHIVTQGDRTQESKDKIPAIGGKGLFTAELEDALRQGHVDLAVHSLKDLPTALAEEFAIGAIPQRGAVEDAFISRSGLRFADLTPGAVVGTSSLRRSSQVLRARPDLRIEHLRGNVESRIRKLRAADSPYDAIILARAGLVRLGLAGEITEDVPVDVMLPAPGQGALGIECRSDDADVRDMLKVLHDRFTEASVGAERSFLAALGAGCNTPVGAFAEIQGEEGREILAFKGRCLSQSGGRAIEVHGEAPLAEYFDLGQRMANEAFRQGFAEINARP